MASLLHMNSSNFVFYSCVFTCNTHPPASDSCRAKQSVHVRIVVAIARKKKKRVALFPSFCEDNVFVSTSYYERVMHICMIKRHA